MKAGAVTYSCVMFCVSVLDNNINTALFWRQLSDAVACKAWSEECDHSFPRGERFCVRQVFLQARFSWTKMKDGPGAWFCRCLPRVAFRDMLALTGLEWLDFRSGVEV